MRESQSYGSLDGMLGHFGREAVFTSLANGIAQGAAGGEIIPRFLLHFITSPTSRTVGNSSSDWFHQLPWLAVWTVFMRATWITRKHMAILKRTN